MEARRHNVAARWSGKIPQHCNSERSEKSLFALLTIQEGFLAALGMTAFEMLEYFNL
jgi:hypothetical protein